MFESFLNLWLLNFVDKNKEFKRSTGFLFHKNDDNQQLVNVN